MYRVVTKHFDSYRNWIVEPGPWHVSKEDADNWASILRHLGYKTHVESHNGPVIGTGNGNSDLRDALASMA